MPLKSRYNANFTGNVTYGHNVLASIITLAVQEIKGVASVIGKGIRTEMIGGKINVDVFINVTGLVSCSDVAFRVQENIKRSVETMTEYRVGIININILGLTVESESDKAAL